MPYFDLASSCREVRDCDQYVVELQSDERSLCGRHRWAGARNRPPPDRARLRARSSPLVVERTFAWLHNFKRLLVRYEHRADIHHALRALGCGLVCYRRLKNSSEMTA